MLEADQVGVADVIGASRIVVSESALERLLGQGPLARGEEEA